MGEATYEKGSVSGWLASHPAVGPFIGIGAASPFLVHMMFFKEPLFHKETATLKKSK